MSTVGESISTRAHAIWVHVRWVRVTLAWEALPPGTTRTEAKLYLKACGVPYWQRMVAMVAGGLVLPALTFLPAFASAGLGGLELLVVSLVVAAVAFGLGMGAIHLLGAEPRLLWGLIGVALLAAVAAWFQPLATVGGAVAALTGAMTQTTQQWRRLDLSHRWWRLAAVLSLFTLLGLTLAAVIGAILFALVAIVIGVIFAACAWVALKATIDDSMKSGE